MQLVKAQILPGGTVDVEEKGKLLVSSMELPELGNFYVTYVSPFRIDFRGGMFAIPGEKTEILIANTIGNKARWYYMGSIFGENDTSTEFLLDAKDSGVPDKEVYRARGVPERVLIQDILGNKLVLSNSRNKEYMNLKAEIESSTGKVMSLDDSPKSDSCYFLNEHGDGLKIASRPSELRGARSIELECKYQQTIISREAGMDLVIVEGRELDIVNLSTGTNADLNEPEKYGNINIISAENDINLTVFEENGSVFIDSLGTGGLIQLDSGGRITIYSEDEINIRSGANMNIKAEGNINMEAGGSIDIKSGGAFSVDAALETDILAGANVNIDGALVHLAGGFAQPTTSFSIEKDTNNYDN